MSHEWERPIWPPPIFMGETAEIFDFSFVFQDALSSVYEISMACTRPRRRAAIAR